LASWASGVIDGIDGLAGGVFGTIFAAFALFLLVRDCIFSGFLSYYMRNVISFLGLISPGEVLYGVKRAF
jgi:UDP-N-acetylmuramyl pentapeptide phosphotransferase/UDP-N-acetylglucosamine-1-phosphate transferase